MEIMIKNSAKSKKIDVQNCIISIQGINENDIIRNLLEEYECEYISNNDLFFVGNNVLDEISIFNNYPELSQVSEILKCFDFDNSFLDKEIDTLSYSKKIILNIIRRLSSLNKIVIFDNIFYSFDMNFRKKLIKLFNLLKDNDYIIFITSTDVNDLYAYSDYSIISSKTIIKFGECNDIYTDVESLKKCKLDIPTLPYITYRAKEDKNVKLFFSKDIRDIIKDIYKHV